ncbi:TMEM175 family protein [Cnuibacter physcomitrellae]|uniref:TMEM175 family protein n=1 Tax=Cnuibacter physcomitrellae TaxID=1619308 RepID=UPI00217609B5|nr:TMEM175 family protein [Cnuibacter physcomitrellae]MCS5495924.1 TMEM175 family protein [Cnuibacter physcomitrellae]
MAHDRSFDRLVNFSDAVVAIAITLLGLPLIDLAAELGQDGIDTVGELLLHNATRLFGFGLSFAVIAVFWMAHHRVYDYLTGYTRGLIWLNMLWLASIVFLPFPTEIIASGHDDAGAAALYIGTMIVTAAALLAQILLVRARPELISGGREALSYVPALAVTVALFVALGVTILVPGTHLWTLLLIVPAQVVTRRIQVARERRTTTPGSR